MTDVNQEEARGAISNKMLFAAGVLGLVVLAWSLVPRFLPLRFWTGEGLASSANAFGRMFLMAAYSHVCAFLMVAYCVFLILSRVKGAKWVWILLGFSVLDTFLRSVGYQRFPSVCSHSFNIVKAVASFAVFTNLAIRNKGGLRIAFGAEGCSRFVSIFVALWWGVFKPTGTLSTNLMMSLRIIGLMGSFFTLFGWMYLLYVARGGRATGEESAATVPWPWRVLVAFFPELLVLFSWNFGTGLGLFVMALAAFAFGAGGPFRSVGMILGGLAYLVFAILVMRCKRWKNFYQLIGYGFALLVANGLVIFSHHHF